MLGRTNRLRTIWEQQLRTPAGRPAGEGFESAAEGWLTCGRVRCVQNRHLHLQQLQDLSWPRRDLHPRRWQGKSCHYDILFATQRAGCESEDRGLGVRRALDRETNRCTLPSGFRHIQWTDSAAAVMQARGRPSAGFCHCQVPLRRSDSILERALIALCVMDSRRSWMPWLGCCSWGNRGLGNVTQRMVAGNCCSSVHVCVTPGGLALTSSKCVLAVVPFH